MARTIWKFTLHPLDPVIAAPKGAVILTARAQGDDICVWAEVNPTEPVVPYRLAVYGTGHKLPDNPGRYIGTAMLMGGGLVFHVYETTAEQD